MSDPTGTDEADRPGGSGEPAADPVELRASDLVRRFGSGRHPHVALAGVSLTVTGTCAIGVVGESGSGKSTLARLLAGLDVPSAGSVTLDGSDVRGMLGGRESSRDFRRRVQLVAQDTTSSFDPRRTLRDAVRLPAMVLHGLNRQAADERVDETLAELGLAVQLADRHPAEVSGGQRQRFSLARALVVRPRILICDEVVSALDVSVQGTILNLLREYCRTHSTGLVFVSHGLPATAFIADEMVVMYHGKIVEKGRTDDIVENCSDPYTARLIAAHSTRGADRAVSA